MDDSSLLKRLAMSMIEVEALVYGFKRRVKKLEKMLADSRVSDDPSAVVAQDSRTIAIRAMRASQRAALTAEALESQMDGIQVRLDLMFEGLRQLEARTKGEVPPTSSWVPVVDIADHFGVTVQTVRNWAKAGHMHASKFGGGWFVDKRTLPALRGRAPRDVS